MRLPADVAVPTWRCRRGGADVAVPTWRLAGGGWRAAAGGRRLVLPGVVKFFG
jgi:hypothetical protein